MAAPVRNCWRAAHKIYPYLLRGLESGLVLRCYLHPDGQRFLYLVVIMDWASRAVLAWRRSNTLGADFCVEALEEALSCDGRPEIFSNTDQGSQFTSGRLHLVQARHFPGEQQG